MIKDDEFKVRTSLGFLIKTILEKVDKDIKGKLVNTLKELLIVDLIENMKLET